jgi:mRNA interferase MazF
VIGGTMIQFDIFTTAGGTYSSKPRPSVIIQSVGFEELDSITVIPITTAQLLSEFRVQLEPSDENGLESTSYVMIDKLTTIKKTALGAKMGHVDKIYIKTIENKLLHFIGLDSK